ncbi:hypothetical protein BAZSYMA_ACONTIG00005_2 [Bathymodiolus azoricus thioautotrophic gill symbiont]|uniref:Uncharacterized protein n=1 Tax=Bathymodiolus azoricus thioautotrophic gill symbiont TaxID=235205 RepID=A0A1H6JTB8_9GAMM|nr:hypothetical protein BAZSYMA_ACONTIG00005_2 [Bathymodiolus azoricus thioautotrophic gill symbiont]
MQFINFLHKKEKAFSMSDLQKYIDKRKSKGIKFSKN